jgi:hypothetical protein
MAAVDHHGELDALGRPKSISASSAERMVRPVKSTSSTSRMRRSSIENRDVGEPDERLRPDRVPHQVVAVERDVEDADRHVGAGDLVDGGGQAPGQRHAAGADADEGQLLDAAVALDDLVGDAGQRPRHADGVDHQRHAKPPQGGARPPAAQQWRPERPGGIQA